MKGHFNTECFTEPDYSSGPEDATSVQQHHGGTTGRPSFRPEWSDLLPYWLEMAWGCMLENGLEGDSMEEELKNGSLENDLLENSEEDGQ